MINEVAAARARGYARLAVLLCVLTAIVGTVGLMHGQVWLWLINCGLFLANAYLAWKNYRLAGRLSP
jgi:hypothetical protein